MIAVNTVHYSDAIVRSELLSAKKYLELTTSVERSNIKHVRFLPSRLGSGKFGTFEVEYRIGKILAL